MHKDNNLNWNEKEKPAPKKRRKLNRKERFLKNTVRPKPAETPLNKEIVNMARLMGIPLVGFGRDKSAFGRP